jgi:hypothetical protein
MRIHRKDDFRGRYSQHWTRVYCTHNIVQRCKVTFQVLSQVISIYVTFWSNLWPTFKALGCQQVGGRAGHAGWQAGRQVGRLPGCGACKRGRELWGEAMWGLRAGWDSAAVRRAGRVSGRSSEVCWGRAVNVSPRVWLEWDRATWDKKKWKGSLEHGANAATSSRRERLGAQ